MPSIIIPSDTQNQAVSQRGESLFRKNESDLFQRTDRLFAYLMILQWLAGIIAAIWISPRTWSGTNSEIHLHVWAATLFGGLITLFPVFLAITRPGTTLTRHVIAVCQMLTAALLIHLSGGRIETHFHIFGSLAFLACYRDWRVLITATIVVAADHFIRSIYFPQSVFGVVTTNSWRAFEHAAWVVFEDLFLIITIKQSRREMKAMARQRAELEATNDRHVETKERYRSILENIIDSVITIGETGIIEEYNSAAEEMFGFTADEVIGKNVSILLPSPYRENHNEYLARYLETGSESVIGIGREVIGKRKDGTTFPIYLSVSEVLLQTNEPLGQPLRIFTGIIRDLTGMKENIELREANRRAEEQSAFGKILDRSLNEIYIFDATSLRFVHVNHGAQDNLGYTMEELRKLTPLDIKPTHTPASFAKLVAPLLEERQDSIKFRTVHRRKDNSDYPVDVHLETSVLNERMVFVAIILDCTERQQNEEQLRKSSERALAAVRSKSEFLANMSHEIRTPMTAILGYADLLSDDQDIPEHWRNAVGTIQKNGQYLLTIINDILDMSKVEAGRMTVEEIKTNPSQIVEEVASLIRPRAKGKGIDVVVNYDTLIPKQIESDPTRLRQILLNLLGNAVKFTEIGKVAIHVAVDSKRHVLRFRVVDTGIGMCPEQRDMIARFDAFRQADGSTTRRFGGTGLGLRISNSLAQLLGGQIEVESKLGVGSTFTVTIRTGDLSGVQMLNPEIIAAGAKQAIQSNRTDNNGASEKSLQGIRLLLAEDGPDNQRLISFVLKKAGAEVTVADNGQIAHDLALVSDNEGNPFDVILMDMQMPVLDGYRATSKLREAGYRGPIIALTAHAMADDRQKCLDAGCDDFSTKPINREKLIANVYDFTYSQNRKHVDASNSDK